MKLRAAVLRLTKYRGLKKIIFYKAVVNVAGCAECFEKIGQALNGITRGMCAHTPV